jgi:hypothetical protein
MASQPKKSTEASLSLIKKGGCCKATQKNQKGQWQPTIPFKKMVTVS